MAYTFEKAADYGLVEPGEYEAIIENIAVATVPTTGTEKLAITFKIRNDIEQGFKNRLVFEDIWKEKENPAFFNRKRLNNIMGTQEIKDGQQFASIDDIVTFLKGGKLIIVVKKEMDTYRNKEVNRIAYYRSSKVKPQKFVADKDLPF
jgi:hypothetical protein